MPNASQSTVFRSYYTYDDNRLLTSVYINDGRPRAVSYVNNNQGQVMARVESSSASSNPWEQYIYVNGHQVGDLGNNGASGTDYTYQQAMAQRNAAPQTGAFTNPTGAAQAYTDFDSSYAPVNPSSLGSTGSTVTVQNGDTLRTLAQRAWGDIDLWRLIAEANGLNGTETLIAGQGAQPAQHLRHLQGLRPQRRPGRCLPQPAGPRPAQEHGRLMMPLLPQPCLFSARQSGETVLSSSLQPMPRATLR